MADHYYTNNPDSESRPETWETTLKGDSFQFTTDSGVFSKGGVDYGSRVLIDVAAAETFPEGSLLDVGCGYGPIGFALAKSFPDREIEMIDINARAIALAKKNAEANRLSNVNIYSSNLFEQVGEKTFAGIITNPPIRAGKKTVHKILEQSYGHLKSGGTLTIVIQKKQGAPSARKKMETIFGNVERIALNKGYWILQSKK